MARACLKIQSKIEVESLDKYEYNIKMQKMKKLVDQKDYETAAKIADTVDWRREKNLRILSTVSLIYEKNERYQDAKDVLLLAYERAPVGRRLLYKLVEISAKEGNFQDAELFYKEYLDEAPQDQGKYILKYIILSAKKEPLDKQIAVLEAYKEREFDEKWAYELAKLYHKAGKKDECVRLCDEIILWFSVGTYVERAMELKQIYEPLTPDQLEKAEHKEKYVENLNKVAREFGSVGEETSALMEAGMGENAVSEMPETEKLQQASAPETEAGPSDIDMGMRSELEDALAAVVKEMAATLSAEPCEGGQTVQEDVMEIEELLEEDEEPEPATEPVQELEVQIPDRLLLSAVAEPDKAVTETVASIRQLHDSLSIPVSKVAKVTGAKLNKMGMQTALGKLDGADMIVIGASELEDGVLEDCVQAVREGSDSMVIALCGSTEEISVLDGRIRGILKTELPELHNAIAKGEAAAVSPAAEITPKVIKLQVHQEIPEPLAEEEPELEKKAESQAAPEPLGEEMHMDIPEVKPPAKAVSSAAAGAAGNLTADAFVDYVKAYANELECIFEDLAELELYAIAEKYLEDNVALTKELAIQLTDEAVDRAEHRGLKGLFSSKYDKEGRLIIRERNLKS